MGMREQSRMTIKFLALVTGKMGDGKGNSMRSGVWRLPIKLLSTQLDM